MTPQESRQIQSSGRNSKRFCNVSADVHKILVFHNAVDDRASKVKLSQLAEEYEIYL